MTATPFADGAAARGGASPGADEGPVMGARQAKAGAGA